MTDFTKINIDAYNKTAREYDAFSRRYRMEDVYQKFTSYMGRTDGEVLDVGCGAGRDVKALSDIGYSVTGIDLSDGMLEIAKVKAPKAKLRKMDFRTLDFPDENFDGFWANASLFLVSRAEIEQAIKELFRVLKKGRVGYLSFKEGEGLQTKLLDGGELKKHQELYAYSEIRDILKKIGFTVVLTERAEDQTRKGLYWLRYFVKKR